MPPKTAPNKRKQQKEDDDSGEDLDDYASNDEEDEYGEQSPQSSFIAEEDDIGGQNINYNQLNEELNKKDDWVLKQRLYDQRQREKTETIDVIAKDTDPFIFRVPIQSGKGPQLVAEICNVLFQGERKFGTEYESFYLPQILSVTTNPNDVENIYIESYDLKSVEQLVSFGLIKKLVRPFKHHLTKQSVVRKNTLLGNITQLERHDQHQLFKLKNKKQLAIKKDEYLAIKKTVGFMRCYGGKLCRVLQVMSKEAKAKVLVLTQKRSLRSKDLVQEHRITLEEYGDDIEQYGGEFECPGVGTFYQGLEVCTVKFGQLQQPTPAQLETASQLQLKQNVQNEIIRVQKGLQPLNVGDIVTIREIKEFISREVGEIQLFGSRGQVIQEAASDLVYTIKLISINQNSDIDSNLAQNLLNREFKIDRQNLVKFIEVGRRIMVKGHGKLDGLIAVVEDVHDVNGEVMVKLQTDIFNEIYDVPEYQITSDQLVVTQGSWAGLPSIMIEGMEFKKQTLVKLPEGGEGMISKLSYIKAQVVDSSNQLSCIRLKDLEPYIPPRARAKVLQDGSVPSKPIGLGSRVRVRSTDAVGDVINFVHKQAQSILFVTIQRSGNSGSSGIIAVDAQEVEQLDPGNFVRKNSNQARDNIVGATVRLTDVRYQGKVGTIVKADPDGVTVQIHDKQVYVKLCFVKILDQQQQQVVPHIGQQTYPQTQFGGGSSFQPDYNSQHPYSQMASSQDGTWQQNGQAKDENQYQDAFGFE